MGGDEAKKADVRETVRDG